MSRTLSTLPAFSRICANHSQRIYASILQDGFEVFDGYDGFRDQPHWDRRQMVACLLERHFSKGFEQSTSPLFLRHSFSSVSSSPNGCPRDGKNSKKEKHDGVKDEKISTDSNANPGPSGDKGNDPSTSSTSFSTNNSTNETYGTGDEKREDRESELLRQHIQQLNEMRSSGHVLEETKTDPRPVWQRWIVDRLFSPMFQWAASDFFRARIEQDFDLEEFLEGAKDAFWMTHKLIGEENYDLLRTMVGEKLLNALEATGKEYKTAGLVWRTEMDPVAHPIQASLRGVSIWSKNEMKEFDKQRAAEAPEEDEASTPFDERDPNTMASLRASMPKVSSASFANKFLVVTVHLQTEQTIIITREEDGAVIARLKDLRPVLWKFARLLPPQLPVRQIADPWWLVTFS